MRRTVTITAALLMVAGAGLGAFWFAKRTVRWNDARTMPPPLAAAVRAYAKGDTSGGLPRDSGWRSSGYPRRAG